MPIIKTEGSEQKLETNELAPANVVDPDPNGSVFISVGSKSEIFRVNCGIFSLASKHFEREIAGLMRQQSQQSRRRTLYIYLRTDDAQIMRNILYIIHHRDGPHEVTLRELVDTARVCHAYQFSKALQGWGSQKISRFRKDLLARSNPARIQLLYCALVFDDHESFSILSRDLILYCNEEDLTSIARSNLFDQSDMTIGHLTSFVGGLKKQHTIALSKVNANLNAACASFIAWKCNIYRKSAKKACDVVCQVGYYSGELVKRKVWPQPADMTSTRLPDIQDAVDKIKRYQRVAPSVHLMVPVQSQMNATKIIAIPRMCCLKR